MVASDDSICFRSVRLGRVTECDCARCEKYARDAAAVDAEEAAADEEAAS